MQKVRPCIHIFIDFDTYKRNFAKQLCTFMENVWLLDPALEAFENTATFRNKVSQMRVYYLLYFVHGRCLATDDSHKYVKETMNICNINEVHPPP